MSFVTSKAQVTWASSMMDHQMLDSLAILTLTGLQTGMTGIQLEHIHSSWQMVPLPGLPRNNMLSHSPPLRLSTCLFPRQQPKVHGCAISSLRSTSPYATHSLSL